MKRHPVPASLHRETAKLIRLALALQESGSQLESQSWQEQMRKHIAQMFQKKQNETLEQALDYLWTENPPACELLAQQIENYAESVTDAAETDAVLIAIPLLAWSRYSIPSGQISKSRLRELRTAMAKYLLADAARITLIDVLYSPEQLPAGFIETRALLQQMIPLALTGEDMHVDVSDLLTSGEYVADVRYVFAAIVVDKGAPLFAWQQAEITQNEALQTWQLHTKDIIAALLPGCHVQTLLPNAFFSAWRKLEYEARAFSLRAAVAYLCEMLEIEASALRAVIAPFYDKVLEEYRIGFSLLKSSQVLHGVTWPLIGDESDETDIISQIEAELEGLGKIVVLTTAMPMEHCDDCGMPLFPNVEGELVHPEMPEPVTPAPTHLH
ncbi:DUF2863 family protein [Sulfuriferula nivalis]|uniref:DUF2863 family protein n=1 Tax=Sulfuriferula nivalis TaxID=2675298 RepID=A0A809RK39_9PROT|nr:DUF2863 family protein [Sulfuriferula nivalis]BBP01946.1 hypothetical protein SFSGTM_26540 [Sulfuriferula nivalis]